ATRWSVRRLGAESAYRVEHLAGMSGNPADREDLRDPAIGADDEGGADQPVILPAVELLAAPNAIGINGLPVGIGEQGEFQRVFAAESAMRLNAVRRYADHDRIGGREVGE